MVHSLSANTGNYVCVQEGISTIQQIEGDSFKSSDIYAPTLKAPEARLLAAIAGTLLPAIEDRYAADIPTEKWEKMRRFI